MKLDHEPVRFEQRGAHDLAGIMESDRRAREIERSARWDIVVPCERAILDPEIAYERNQKPAGHGVNEWRTAFDRILVSHIYAAEGPRRHRLEPARYAQRRRDRWRQF